MSQTIDVNGQSINYPETGDPNWGDEATNFAVQTSAALGKLGLASGTSVDIAQTLDVTGNTTLDANLSVAGTTSLTGNVTLTNNLTVNGNTTLGNANTDATTITGIVKIDSGVLYVDPVNNRVGINDTTPSEALDINGNALISGTLGVTGTTSLSNTLGVIGDVSVNTNKFNITASSGNTSIAGTLGVTGDVAINTNKFNVTASSGNTTIAGTLNVTGNTTLNGNLIAKAQYINIVDQKANGTAGGTFTSGGWRTRDLNTIRTNTITGASLSSNQITLPTGDYYIFCSAPSFVVNQNKIKLYNITDLSDVIIGTSEINTQGSRSFLSGRFSILSQKIFEIQHYCLTTRATDGFGTQSSFGVVEIYTMAEIWKIG